MAIKRRKHGPKFKARVALDAVRGDKTVAEICREHAVHSSQVARWKSQLLDHLPDLFEDGGSPADVCQKRLIEELFAMIGRLKVENDFLKKDLVLTNVEKRALIEPRHELSIVRQRELLGLPRSG